MNSKLKNVLAIIIGWVGGSAVNMGLVMLGHKVLPIEGVDPNDMDALAVVMPSLTSEYFIFPFLSHALGVLVGAAIAAYVAVNHKMKYALGIGAFFLLGGIIVSYMLPAPTWFVLTDILIAYIPMAWLGGKIGMKIAAK